MCVCMCVCVCVCVFSLFLFLGGGRVLGLKVRGLDLGALLFEALAYCLGFRVGLV